MSTLIPTHYYFCVGRVLKRSMAAQQTSIKSKVFRICYFQYTTLFPVCQEKKSSTINIKPLHPLNTNLQINFLCALCDLPLLDLCVRSFLLNPPNPKQRLQFRHPRIPMIPTHRHQRYPNNHPEHQRHTPHHPKQ